MEFTAADDALLDEHIKELVGNNSNGQAAAAGDAQENENGGENAGLTKKQKKKNKKKKKKQAKAQTKEQEEQFNQWCVEALEKTKSQTDTLDEAVLSRMPPSFKNFNFTGDLRPAYVTPQRTFPDSIVPTDYAVGGLPLSEMKNKGNLKIHVHDEKEIETLRNVCAIGREVLDIAGRFLKAGVTGDDIDRIVYAACLERGVYSSPLNYHNFPKSVCVSVNEVICHGIPDCRVIKEGDIVNLDVTVYKDGFHADLNETYLIGKCDDSSKNLVRVAYDCLTEAQKLIKPGTMYRDLGATISHCAAQSNCSVVKSYCGHGIGRLFHTAPNVPHYNKNKAIGIMRPGHVFTIEPMINDGPNWRDVTWPDNWTAVTKDGKRSAQFEHTFLVTETGCEILTNRVGSSKTEMVWDEAAVQR